MKVSILDRRYIYVVGCFGPLLVPVELSDKEIKQLHQLGYKMEVHVPNKPPVEDPSITIELRPSEFTIEEGQTQKLTIYENGLATDKVVTLQSSKPEIATVDNCVVTGLKAGDSIITAVHRGVSLMSVATITAKPEEEATELKNEVKVEDQPVNIPEVKEEKVEPAKVEEVKAEEKKEEPVKEETVTEEPVKEEKAAEEVVENNETEEATEEKKVTKKVATKKVATKK